MLKKIGSLLAQPQINSYLEKIKSFFFSALVVNSVSFIFSAPILLWWGIPISALTLVGNVFFTPFLALFILLSSLFTVCAATGITPTPFAWALNTLTEIWLQLLNLGSKKVLFAQLYSPILLAMLIAIVLGVGYKLFEAKSHQKILKVLLCGVFLVLCVFALPLKNNSSTLSNNSGTITILDTPQGLNLLDEGFLKGMTNPAKQVSFTIKMPVIRSHGTCKIAQITTNTASIRTFQGLKELVYSMKVEKIVLPQLTNPQKTTFWKAFYGLKYAAQQAGVKLSYLPKVRDEAKNVAKTSSRCADVKSGHNTSRNANSA
jgi:hypothetical protein